MKAIPVYVLSYDGYDNWMSFMYDEHLYRVRRIEKRIIVERYQYCGNSWHIVPLDDDSVEAIQFWMMDNTHPD